MKRGNLRDLLFTALKVVIGRSKPATLRGDILYLPEKGGYHGERSQNGRERLSHG